jgi:hypothetical protein
MSTSTASSDQKPDLERERMLSRKEAARLKGISVDTLDRHYRHLFRRISPRRIGIKLADLLATD